LELKIKDQLIKLFESHFKEEVIFFEQLPASGSYREYARIKSISHQVIGAYNQDIKENQAFLEFSAHFRNKNIPVPDIYAVNNSMDCYLQEDLGNTTLFEFISITRENEGFSTKIVDEYKKVLRELPRIQLVAGKDIDYSVCYPREAFDKQSMMWDLNYFTAWIATFRKIWEIPHCSSSSV